jgi:DNA polymerase-3 subunit alpha
MDMTAEAVGVQGHEASSQLIKLWLREGWKFRARTNPNLRKKRNQYLERMNYELNLIETKDFTDYFLVTSDIVRWAKDHKIPVGSGRGSAAASLICYLLRITELDPIQFPNMLFERFIDPSRKDLPDVDLDFSDDRRHEIFEYAEQKYGKDRVAHIGNFTRYRGKNSLDDVARVYRIPKWEIDIVKDLVTDLPDGDPRQFFSLRDAFDTYPQAAEVLKRRPQLKYAMNLEGNYRNMAVHAAGLVISNTPISDTCAVYEKTNAAGETFRVVAYDKWDAEYVGMLKLDILGLSTMGMIGIALDEIGMDLEDLYALPLDDKKTLRAFRQGDVTGIFQFEGRTTRLICQEVRPSTFLHLADINALSRPGPLFSGMKTQYVNVRNGTQELESIHPLMDGITSHTYGTLTYQEQVMSIFRDIGGFPGERVNGVRKIMGKKLGGAQFAQLFDEFAQGAKDLHGMKPETARRIWRMMENSSAYLFNFAHSASYAHLAYICQWLKQNYPTAFFAAQLAKVGDGKDKLEKRQRLMLDAMRGNPTLRRAPQVILPPDILTSERTWSTKHQPKNTIRAGFVQVPKVGKVTSEAIVKWRDELLEKQIAEDPKRAGFISWTDMAKSVPDGGVYRVGAVTVENMLKFVNAEDPFELERTADLFKRLRTEILVPGNEFGMPVPTHTSVNMPKDRNQDGIIWAGVVKKRAQRDYVADQRSRFGKTREEVLADMKDPHLTKSATLYCYDDFDELSVKFNRYEFAKFQEAIESIEVGLDVVVITGKKLKDYGTSLYAKNIHILSLDDEDTESENEE